MNPTPSILDEAGRNSCQSGLSLGLSFEVRPGLEEQVSCEYAANQVGHYRPPKYDVGLPPVVDGGHEGSQQQGDDI